MKINIKQINIKHISVSHQNISQRVLFRKHRLPAEGARNVLTDFFLFFRSYHSGQYKKEFVFNSLVDGSGMSRYTAKVCSPKSTDLDVKAIERNAVIRQTNAIHASMHINLLKQAWKHRYLLTCSAGVSAQRAGSPQRGHRRAHALHHPQLAVLDAGSSGRGTRGVEEPGGGRRERRDGGGRRCGGRGQGDIARVLPRLLLDDGELKETQVSHTSAARALFALNKNIDLHTFTRSCVTLCNTSVRVWWTGQNTERPSGLRGEKGASFPEAEQHVRRLTYLFEPHAVSVGQNVQSVLPLGLLHPLSGGIRVVATFPTTFQHPPSPYSLVPILPEHESTSDSAISFSHTRRRHTRIGSVCATLAAEVLFSRCSTATG